MTILSSPIGADYRPATAAAVQALADSGVPVHLPGTEAYAALHGHQQPHQGDPPRRPSSPRAAPTDVSRTLRVAATAGLRVAVQGTGHGATETMQDAILVSTAALDELTVHADERWARIGAGVRWAAVLEACAPYGLAGLAGSSPDVGVVGYLTGGGLGPVARTHGLASDTVRAFEVVTGDGVVRRRHRDRATRTCSGACAAARARSASSPRSRSTWSSRPTLYAGALWFAGADAAAVVRTWSQWCDAAARGGHHVDRGHAAARPADVPRAAARHAPRSRCGSPGPATRPSARR